VVPVVYKPEMWTLAAMVTLEVSYSKQYVDNKTSAVYLCAVTVWLRNKLQT